jgi:vacuolar-type H+-ATPase subunit F/Vma7
MASHCVFIGDAISAAAWRLAGADCRTPALQAVAALLRTLQQEPRPDLILISADYAAAVPPAQRDALLAAQAPRCLVIADGRGRSEPADRTAALKRQLGLAE